jgi:hypothetical protein
MKSLNPKDYQIHITSSIHSSTNKQIFIARVTEVKNIYVEESTPKKAYDQAIEEIKIFKEHYDKNNLNFPEPLIAQKFSGDLRVRLGEELHKKVAINAAQEGISLNKYIKDKLKAS